MHIVNTASNGNNKNPSCLGGGLQDPDLALGVIRPLIDQISLAVPSYRGLGITLVVAGYPITVTELDDDVEVGDMAASLLLPLTAVCDVGADSVLVFYAATPGAFVDLAADLSYALNLSLDTVVLDQHLTPLQAAAGIAGTGEFSHVNQALGILIDRGDTPDQARTHLQYLADRADTTVPITARRLIDATSVRRLAQHPPRRRGHLKVTAPSPRPRPWPPHAA